MKISKWRLSIDWIMWKLCYWLRSASPVANDNFIKCPKAKDLWVVICLLASIFQTTNSFWLFRIERQSSDYDACTVFSNPTIVLKLFNCSFMPVKRSVLIHYSVCFEFHFTFNRWCWNLHFALIIYLYRNLVWSKQDPQTQRLSQTWHPIVPNHGRFILTIFLSLFIGFYSFCRFSLHINLYRTIASHLQRLLLSSHDLLRNPSMS